MCVLHTSEQDNRYRGVRVPPGQLLFCHQVWEIRCAWYVTDCKRLYQPFFTPAMLQMQTSSQLPSQEHEKPMIHPKHVCLIAEPL